MWKRFFLLSFFSFPSVAFRCVALYFYSNWQENRTVIICRYMKRRTEKKNKPNLNHAQSSWARVCRCWCGACSTLYYYSRFSIPLHIQFVIRKYFIQFFIFVLLVFLLPSRFSPRFFCISRQWLIFWLATNSPIFIMPLDCIPRIYYYLYTMNSFDRGFILRWFFLFTKSNNKSLINYLLFLLSSSLLEVSNKSTRKTENCKVESWLYRCQFVEAESSHWN